MAGHVFCSFLALLLRKELEDRLARKQWNLEWADVIRDLDNLVEIEVSINGKKYVFRGQAPGVGARFSRPAAWLCRRSCAHVEAGFSSPWREGMSLRHFGNHNVLIKNHFQNNGVEDESKIPPSPHCRQSREQVQADETQWPSLACKRKQISSVAVAGKLRWKQHPGSGRNGRNPGAAARWLRRRRGQQTGDLAQLGSCVTDSGSGCVQFFA